MMPLETWQREIIVSQLKNERLYASDTPLAELSGWDFACAQSVRSKYSKAQMQRRLRWLERCLSEDRAMPLCEVE